MKACKIDCFEIRVYIDFVRSGKIEVCKEQLLLCDYIEKVFEEEELFINKEQLKQYLSFEQYFPFKLFEWEKFVFALHNCVYKSNGQLRWKFLLLYAGRGVGKNGYLAFEDFCLLTPVNGVREYHIDIFATSEDQAKTSFMDIYNVLSENEKKMSKFFEWNKEVIKNKKTGSELRFRTNNFKTKDGGRPGKVDHDEVHAYENSKLIDVSITGLGKKKYPRRTVATTDGDVRDGPLDRYLKTAIEILEGKRKDNGMLPFICRLDSEEEVHQEKNWTKSNPSLIYLPDLLDEIRTEYEDYTEDPMSHLAFMTKRMNRPQGDKESEVTSWENVLATNRPLPDLRGQMCVGGLDYAKTTDFVSVGLLFIIDSIHYWITKTWVCKACNDLGRIKFPLDEAAARNEIEWVDDVEISPELPANWFLEMSQEYIILGIAIDSYRHTLMKPALENVGFDAKKDGRNNIKLVRPSDEMQIVPIITSLFNHQQIIWGDVMIMRWYTNNSKQELSTKGNITYGKQEPKSRKTDGFKAFVAAETLAELLEQSSVTQYQEIEVAIY